MKAICFALGIVLCAQAEVKEEAVGGGKRMFTLNAGNWINGTYVDVVLSAMLEPGKTPDYAFTLYVSGRQAARLARYDSLTVTAGTNKYTISSDSPAERSLDKNGDVDEFQHLPITPIQFRDICRADVAIMGVKGAETFEIATAPGELQTFFRAVTNAAYTMPRSVVVGRNATAPASLPAPTWRFTERNSTWWRCSYQVSIPPGKEADRIKVQFLDEQGFELAYAMHYNASGTITSSKLIGVAVAPKVKSVTAKYGY